MHILEPFDYFEPETLDEASELLSYREGEARILAGGLDLIPRMRKGNKMDSHLIHEAAKAAAGEAEPMTDLRSTADYRREMTGVLVRRALEKAQDAIQP
jgi:CO/xanthine dehydrogenase FAD-binding subunit